ncbi:MAG: hypothetical protein WAT66_11780 [Actinomycetota bacterium]
MKRFVLLAILTAATVAALLPAQAGSPHFVGDPVLTRSGNTLTVTGKEAGLGNEEQIHVVLSATAECINGGGNHPKAANKISISAAGDFPVQNGKANFTLSVTATFDPNCSPPMTVRFRNVTLTDTTNGLSKSFSGTI